MTHPISPLFLMHADRLERNLRLIRDVETRSGAQILLAFKAFAQWRLFPRMKPYVSGFTASTLNEVRLGREGFDMLAHSYAVAYKPDDFDDIVAQSSHITFNSLTEYHRWIDRVPDAVSVGLRVNPEWSDVETDLYNPSGAQSRLGMTAAQLPETLPARIEGLHVHVLCESMHHAFERLSDQVEQQFGRYFEQMKWVNLGGGHLMTHADYDIDRLIQRLQHLRKAWGVALILEPGSAWVWQSGDLHTTVLDIITNGGAQTAIIDASFTCHMPDCLEMPYRPQVVGASERPTEQGYPYRLGGVSCLAGDYLDTYYFEKPLQAGDPVVFQDMLHYTMVKTTSFNGVGHPALGIQTKDGFELLRTYRFEDYKQRMS